MMQLNPITGQLDIVGGVDAAGLKSLQDGYTQTKDLLANNTTVFKGEDFPTPLTRKPKFFSLCDDDDGLDLGLEPFPVLNADGTHWDIWVVNGDAVIYDAVLTVM